MPPPTHRSAQASSVRCMSCTAVGIPSLIDYLPELQYSCARTDFFLSCRSSLHFAVSSPIRSNLTPPHPCASLLRDSRSPLPHTLPMRAFPP